MRDRVEKALKLAARVAGDMAGAIARGRLRPSDLANWSQRLRWAADELEKES